MPKTFGTSSVQELPFKVQPVTQFTEDELMMKESVAKIASQEIGNYKFCGKRVAI